MRTGLAIALLVFGIICATGISAQQRDFSKIPVTAQKVNGSVYMLTGAGGNVAVSIGSEGLLMVDTDFGQMSEKIDAAIKKLSDKPIRYVVDTHWHLDHASGNAYFQDRGAIVIANEQVRNVLASGTMRDGVKYDPAAKSALPSLTYGDHATLYLNGEEVRLTHFPHAHTDGDTGRLLRYIARAAHGRRLSHRRLSLGRSG